MTEQIIKQTCQLALKPKRNLLSDLTVGWGRLTFNEDEQVTPEQAEVWLAQDIEKARKFIEKHGVKATDHLILAAHYITSRRWEELASTLKLLREGHKVKAALDLANKSWFKNNPQLGSKIGQSILRGK